MNKQQKQIGFVLRKILHIVANGSVAVVSFLLPDHLIFPMTASIFFLVFVFELIRLKTKAKDLVNATIDPVLKNKEKQTFTGIFWIASAALLASPFVDAMTMSYAFAVFALADPMAALVGRYIKSNRIYRKKSISGSSMFFVVAFCVTLFFQYVVFDQMLPDQMLVIIPFVLTFVEMFSYPVDDNFSLIVSSSLLVHFFV